MKQKQRSAVSWLAEFAGEKKSLYAASVIIAVLGVAFAMVSYVIMGDIVANIVDGNGDWTFYLREGLIIAGLWILDLITTLLQPIQQIIKCFRPIHQPVNVQLNHLSDRGCFVIGLVVGRNRLCSFQSVIGNI